MADNSDYYLEPDKDYEYRVLQAARDTLNVFKAISRRSQKLLDDNTYQQLIKDYKTEVEKIDNNLNPLIIRSDVRAEMENADEIISEISEMLKALNDYVKRLSEATKLAKEMIQKDLEISSWNFNNKDSEDPNSF